jgi:hypothetical protein
MPQMRLGSTTRLEEPTYSIVRDLHGFEMVHGNPCESVLVDGCTNQVEIDVQLLDVVVFLVSRLREERGRGCCGIFAVLDREIISGQAQRKAQLH